MKLDDSVTESRLDSLLERFIGIHFGRHSKHTDGRFPRLSNVEQVIKESLSRMLREFIEMVEKDDCRHWFARFAIVSRM